MQKSLRTTYTVVVSSREAKKSIIQMFQCRIHIIRGVPPRKADLEICGRGCAIENKRSSMVSGCNWRSGGDTDVLDFIGHLWKEDDQRHGVAWEGSGRGSSGC